MTQDPAHDQTPNQADDQQNWERLQELFHLVVNTPAAERERVLEAHCDSPDLRRRVMEILDGADLNAPDATPTGAPILNERIGPYSLIRHIGSGGIGSVYLVERIAGGAVQRSALKVLAPHAAGPMFVEKFRREQHILASLDHPNITRMTDAGLGETGQPYLVMEYVDGIHLDAYCDQHGLGIAARLQLFLCVCDAVAYAHRNLVVHLDLKPSNILVTADGVVKLLDFGTSKLLESDGLRTTTVMATPAYASPEQLRHEAITTACDIYSLGTILFELLAGRRPGAESSVAAMIERAIREENPERLEDAVRSKAAARRGLAEGRLRTLLRGDLATIVAKCLNPRPQDRYTSVHALEDDIQRYLGGRSVLARPQTAIYKLGKFVRRNRRAVAAALIFAVIVTGSLGYAWWRQQESLRDGRRALQMQTFLYRLFKLANSDYTGKPAATVPEFLQMGVKLLPGYIKDPEDLRVAQMGLAESMYENGDLDSAQKVFRQTTASAKAAGDVGAEAESEAFSGNIAYLQGQMGPGQSLTADALRLSRQPGVTPTVRAWSEIFYAVNRDNNGFRTDDNVRLLQSAVKESREHNLPARETAFAIYSLAADLELRGRLDEAEALFKELVGIYKQDPLALCDQSELYGELAFISEARGNETASLPLYRQAYEGYKTCSGPDSRGALEQGDYLAGALIKLGRAPQAVVLLEKDLPAWRKMAGSSPDLAEPLYFLALAYVETGRFPEAEKLAKESVDVQTGKVDPTDRRFGACHMIWARALVGQGRYQEALPHAEIADKLLTAKAVSAHAKKAGADARQLLTEIQSKLPQPSREARPRHEGQS